MTRAITSHELALLRSDGQASELFLAFPAPSVIFSALVNQTFITTDSVAEIIYDTSTGTYTDIKQGMTLWVGSTPGAYDLGIARIRKDPSATVIYVGETSDLKIDNNVYLTVMDEFLPWARHLRIKTVPPYYTNLDLPTFYVDYDIDYVDQYVNMNPLLRMGPDAVLYYPEEVVSGGNPKTFSFDGSPSIVLDGSTISSWAWAGGSSVTGETTATPTFTFTAAGTYRISCLVQSTNGTFTTGWRTVVVYDASNPPITDFLVTAQPTAGVTEGGWSCTVKLYDQAAITTVHERQQIFLFSRDWFAGTEQELGPVPGRENILMMGWVAKETMHYDPDGAYVEFTVQGPNYWMNNETHFILGIEDTDETSSNWVEFHNLTVDKGLFSLLYWHSTIPFILDAYLTEDSRPFPSTEAAEGTLWSQLNTIAWESILARPLCNRYGQLYIEIHPNLIPVADRSGFPIVMDVTTQDCKKGSTDIGREPTPKVGTLASSGVEYAWGNGGIGTARLSYAPGHVFKQFGKSETLDKLLVSSQSQLNDMTGLYIAYENNPYSSNKMSIAQNNRFIDLCPRQYFLLDRSGAENPRDIPISMNVIPTKITMNFDSKTASFSTDIEGEAETQPDTAITGDIPAVSPPEEPALTPFPTVPPFAFPSSLFGYVTKTYTWAISNPTTGGIVGPRLFEAYVAVRVDAYIVGGTSVNFRVENRDVIGTTGLELIAADTVAIPTGVEVDAFDNAFLSAGDWLWLNITGKVGSPTQLVVTVTVRLSI